MPLSSSAIHDRAYNKAFAKIVRLEQLVEESKRDVEMGYTGGVTQEEIELILEGNKKELAVWNYIAVLIEKSNKI